MSTLWPLLRLAMSSYWSDNKIQAPSTQYQLSQDEKILIYILSTYMAPVHLISDTALKYYIEKPNKPLRAKHW